MNITHRAVILASVAVTAFGCATSDDAETSTADLSGTGTGSTVATIASGQIAGSRSALGGIAFQGIPFAESTGGDARWQPPRPIAPWPGIKDTTAFGPKCLQPGDDGAATGDEDCLTVNVWTPGLAGGARRPVIVFFYGGFNVTGSTSDKVGQTTLYDGTRLAENGDAVVVTANYRVGAMGFLTHPSLATDDGASGNYGLMDQIAALQWVKENAAAFGGDPSRVMVMGQSAGAFDTCAVVTSPAARGLFSSAAMHSGGCRALARASAEKAGAGVAERLGCSSGDVAACLRSQSANALMRAVPLSEAAAGAIYWPNVDGVVLPRSPLELVDAGEHNKVPMIIGSTRDEASLIAAKITPTPVDSEESFAAAVRTAYPGDLADRVLAVYPVAGYPSAKKAHQALVGDAAFICPTRRAARAFAAQGSPVYRFEFAHKLHDLLLGPAGASHGFDLFFLFKNFVHWFPSAAEYTLADSFAGYWGRFAATGDPNGADAVRWERFEEATDSNLTFDDVIAPGVGHRGPQCDFWDGITTRSGE